MAAIDDLLNRIEDEELRTRIIKEVKGLQKNKKFGLVFEEHLPECTPLYDVPVKAGRTVALKNGSINDNYIVLDINADVKIVSANDETAGGEFVDLDLATANQLLYLSLLMDGNGNIQQDQYYANDGNISTTGDEE